ncbi:MAG: hypothetical protein IPK08_18720 [Bacteroidetes bacterium]|nr:hypothetical protein [Bacteroidota bacterium]
MKSYWRLGRSCEELSRNTITKMITAIDDKKLNALINKAMEIDTTYKEVNFKNYFFINCPADIT